LTKIRNK